MSREPLPEHAKAVRKALREVGEAFPTVRGMMRVERHNGGQTGDLWVRMICQVDVPTAVRVMEDIVDGAIRWRHECATLDMLPAWICEEVDRRKDRAYRKFTQLEKYHSLKKVPWRDDKVQARWTHAVRLCLAETQPPDRLEELVSWSRGGQQPHWMESEDGQTRTVNDRTDAGSPPG